MPYRSRNHEIDFLLRSGAELSLAAAPPDKRMVVFSAVQKQLEKDEKRPWSLSQKLNDAPYRYNRDELWSALDEISVTLKNGDNSLIFATEDDFVPAGGFAAFVNKCLTGTVSALINAIVDKSRWP